MANASSTGRLEKKASMLTTSSSEKTKSPAWQWRRMPDPAENQQSSESGNKTSSEKRLIWRRKKPLLHPGGMAGSRFPTAIREFF
jgi:hypothetical protein